MGGTRAGVDLSMDNQSLRGFQDSLYPSTGLGIPGGDRVGGIKCQRTETQEGLHLSLLSDI